jgi:hypothetical protein
LVTQYWISHTAVLKIIKQNFIYFIFIFKEFIQNAEDAGATEVKFIIDKRQSVSRNKSFETLHGPAMLCWNNTKFNEEDLAAITNLGLGSKSRDSSKIGRFGVGFNIVYHLTDAPQFLSNFENYVIFDPLCASFPDLNRSDPGCLIKNAETNLKNSIFSDLLTGFELDELSLKGSTLFRLPLRDKQSDLGYPMSTYRVEDMMAEFITKCPHALLFLKNVKKVGFYEYDESKKLKLIGDINVQVDPDDILNNSTNSDIRFDEIEVDRHEYKLSIQRSFVKPIADATTINETIDYLILEQFGFDQELMTDEESERLTKMCDESKEKYEPVGSIAVEIGATRSKKDSFKLFSFLPLDQVSPFPVHVNGYFTLLHENRTNIFEHGLRTVDVNLEASEWCTDWNSYIFQFIILPLYLRMLECLKDEYFRDTKSYLEMMPRLPVDDKKMLPYIKPMLFKFYNSIYSQCLIPVQNSKDGAIQWFEPRELRMSSSLSKFYFLNPPKLSAALSALDKAGINFCPHTDLISLFKNAGDLELTVLSVYDVLEGFKAIKADLENQPISETVIKSVDNLMIVLDFCMNSADSEILSDKDKKEWFLNEFNNCPLLVDQDLKIKCFSSANKLLLEPRRLDANCFTFKGNYYEIMRNFSLFWLFMFWVEVHFC